MKMKVITMTLKKNKRKLNNNLKRKYKINNLQNSKKWLVKS